MTLALAIDVESSALPAQGMKVGDPAYPWPVSLAAVLFDFTGKDHGRFSTRIRSEGRSVASGAERVHGIGTREAAKTGIAELVALSVVCHFAGQAQYLVGFNVQFDRNILESSLINLGRETQRLIRPGLAVVDLLPASTAFCKINSEHADGGYRWPKLSAALEAIRNERPRQGHHDALADACAAKRLFLSLHHRGALDISEAA